VRHASPGDRDGIKARLCGLLVSMLALATGSSWSQQPAVVQLHHRSAESLITVLRPLVAPSVVTGAGTQLQVRASPNDLPRVRQLIEQSDRPLQPLAVALSDERPDAADVKASSEPPPRHGSVTLGTGRAMPPDPVGNGQIVSTLPGAGSTRVLEGEALRISMPTTQSLWFGVQGTHGTVATPSAAAATTGEHASAAAGAQGVVHFDAVSDVTARIWLADTTVAIDLQPMVAGGVDAGFGRNADHATVYGRIGQWIALADSGTGLQAPSQPAAAPRTGLWIKVDPAPDTAGSSR
jgi:hypothetical protein